MNWSLFNIFDHFLSIMKRNSAHFQVILRSTPLCEECCVLRLHLDFLVLRDKQISSYSQPLMENHQHRRKHNPSMRDILLPDMRTKYWKNIFLCSSQAIPCIIRSFIAFHLYWKIIQIYNVTLSGMICCLINLNRKIAIIQFATQNLFTAMCHAAKYVDL